MCYVFVIRVVREVIYIIYVSSYGSVTQSRPVVAIPWTVAPRILCPWNFPGNNTGVDCHFFHKSTFLIQGAKLSLVSPVSAGRFFTTSTTWEALIYIYTYYIYIYIYICNIDINKICILIYVLYIYNMYINICIIYIIYSCLYI